MVVCCRVKRRDDEQGCGRDCFVGGWRPLTSLDLVGEPDVERVGESDGGSFEGWREGGREAELELKLTDAFGQCCIFHEHLFLCSEDGPHIPF